MLYKPHRINLLTMSMIGRCFLVIESISKIQGLAIEKHIKTMNSKVYN
jgi:hypothetical protein